MTDREAMGRSLADPDAFLVVFERHYDAIASYLARRLPAELAAELASETFVRAFAARGRFVDCAQPDALPFLYGIAANLIRRHYRSEQRMLRAYARVALDEVAGAPAETSDPRALAAVLAQLTPGEREVLLLYAWADFDYEQIATALGIAVGTVRSRLSRARQRLRPVLRHPARLREEALDG